MWKTKVIEVGNNSRLFEDEVAKFLNHLEGDLIDVKFSASTYDGDMTLYSALIIYREEN